MPQPPELAPESRQAGLQRSLQLRRTRAQLKREITEHGLPMFWVMFNHAGEAQGMRVRDLLTALPGIGKARADAMLEAAGIGERTTVRATGPRQQAKLFALLNK